MAKQVDTIEILFVAEASDGRGPRVLIREGMCENTIWNTEDIQDVDAEVLGISPEQQKQIRDFLRV